MAARNLSPPNPPAPPTTPTSSLIGDIPSPSTLTSSLLGSMSLPTTSISSLLGLGLYEYDILEKLIIIFQFESNSFEVNIF